MTDNDWKLQAKGLLRAEIVKRNLSYIEIADKLKALGIDETPQNISNKIGRGTFSAIFMIQVLTAIGCNELRLD